LKILQLIQKPQLRGAEIFASQLSNHLLDEGHEVVMISLLPGESSLPFNGNIIRLDRPLSKRFIDVKGWRELAMHIQKFKPDVIQANAGDTLKFAVFSRLLFRWKVPIVFRNANKVSDFIATWPKLIFNKFLIIKVAHVISVSELCRQDFIKTYSPPHEKTTTVPIGIEINAMPNQIAYPLT
jgi:L-malate glycosyltransferase